MKLKDEEKPYYLVDFCRKKDNQQIKVVDTDDDEIKLFLFGIFSNKRKLTGKAEAKDGTLIRIRCINTKDCTSQKVANLRVYNMSPTQARIYTIKCMKYYFQNETVNDF